MNELIEQLTQKQLKNRYNVQKIHAKLRGIDWQFTYANWIEWWGDDINKRGRAKNDLVMARYDDQGPYHPTNVKKITVGENSLERNKRYMRKVTTKHGEFESIEAAAKFYKVNSSAITKAMRYENSKKYGKVSIEGTKYV